LQLREPPLDRLGPELVLAGDQLDPRALRDGRQVARALPDLGVQVQEALEPVDGEAFALVRAVDQLPEELLVVWGRLLGLDLPGSVGVLYSFFLIKEGPFSAALWTSARKTFWAPRGGGRPHPCGCIAGSGPRRRSRRGGKSPAGATRPGALRALLPLLPDQE